MRSADGGVFTVAELLRMHYLPRRITAFMGATVGVLVVTLAACVLWLCGALDHDAQARSGDLVESATAALLRQIRTDPPALKWSAL